MFEKDHEILSLLFRDLDLFVQKFDKMESYDDGENCGEINSAAESAYHEAAWEIRRLLEKYRG